MNEVGKEFPLTNCFEKEDVASVILTLLESRRSWPLYLRLICQNLNMPVSGERYLAFVLHRL